MSFLLLLALACGRGADAPAASRGASHGPADVSALTAVTNPSGLSWYVLTPGDGAVAATGDKVAVHYTGWLTNGTKFDSSHDRGKPIKFTLGAHRVIQGWEDGILGMKVGEKRQLHIPSGLGYGSRGMGDAIPPDADLLFDVELVEIAGK